MNKKTKNGLPGKPLFLSLSLAAAVGLSMLGPIPSAQAHSGCKDDLQDLEQTIMGIESMLKTVEWRKPKGSTQRRRHKAHMRKLQKMLQANRNHIDEARAAGCPEAADPLEERVRFLEHKLKHLSK